MRGFLKPTIKFEIPDQIDEEGNQISLRVLYNKTFPCQCVRERILDGKYYIEVDKRKITFEDQGTYRVRIELTDDVYNLFYRKNVYQFNFEINYDASRYVVEQLDKAAKEQMIAKAGGSSSSQ